MDEEAAAIALRWAERRGIQEASPVYASLLRQCCASRSLRLGKLVHSSIQRAGLGSDTFLANLLLHMYSECGRIDDACSAFDAIARKNVFSGNLMIAAYAQAGHLEGARMVFEEMPVRSTVSWNSLMGAFSRSGRPVESLVLFWAMNLEGVRPNSVTFMAAIEACTAMEELSHGRLVHAVVLSCEEEASVGVMNALINMYGKHSRVSEAREIFASIRKSHRDVISWNSMIAVYARNGRLQEAKDTFDAMDLDRNTVTWNTMIGAYAQSESSGAGALVTLALMDQHGIDCNACTFISVFDACARISALQQGRLVHSFLLESPEDHSRYHLEVGNSIIHMYGSCGCSREAEETLQRMQSRNVVSWSALVAAHVQAGDISSAVTSFHKMAIDGVLPNEVTFLAVLNALGHSGDVKRGWSFFASMHHDYGLCPGIDHIVCIVDLLGRAGLIEQAERIVLDSAFARSSVPWIALLSACKSSHNPGRIIQNSGSVARKALELNTANKSSPYVLVSNAVLDSIPYFPAPRASSVPTAAAGGSVSLNPPRLV